ncbi:MAG: 3-hydroxyacyl-CoA dehydrogenase NAD-binding domain-containing protein [Pseudolabrys sp.]
MAKARIAVVGAGLMGHGIAQVFALAGHHVTIYDSIVASLDTVKTRILTNLKDLGDDQKAVERVTPVSDLAQAVRDADYVVEAVLEDLPAQAKIVRRNRKLRSPRHDPGQQYVCHPYHQDHGGTQAAGARAWNALVESALPRAVGRSDRDSMDEPAGD